MSCLKQRRIIFGLVLTWIKNSLGSNCQPCWQNDEVGDFENNAECSSLIKITRTLLSGSSECSSNQLELFQLGCCEPEVKPPKNHCTLCPDGRPFNPNIAIPSFADDNDKEISGILTCATLSDEADFWDYLFEAGSCEDTQLRRSAAWCQCPQVSKQCSLCGDGIPPPNPTLVDKVYYGWSCAAFDFVASYFKEDECLSLMDDILEFDAASFCGCPNSVAVPQVCQLCPEGFILANPDLPLGHQGEFTCRDLALSTRYIPAQEPCDRVLATHTQNGYIDNCCSPMNQVSIQLGGTAISSTTSRHRFGGSLALFACALVLLSLMTKI